MTYHINDRDQLFLQARGERYYPFKPGDHFYELQFYDSELSSEGVKRKHKLMAEIRDEFGIKPNVDLDYGVKITDLFTPEEQDEKAKQVANKVLAEERTEDSSIKAKVLFVIGISIGLILLIVLLI
jgi:hypothetical protein